MQLCVRQHVKPIVKRAPRYEVSDCIQALVAALMAGPGREWAN
jgi:hypothetical protein